jgi:hypothetical protein
VRISTTLLHELKRRGSKYGLATMCGGVGQGLVLFMKIAVKARLMPDTNEPTWLLKKFVFSFPVSTSRKVTAELSGAVFVQQSSVYI